MTYVTPANVVLVMILLAVTIGAILRPDAMLDGLGRIGMIFGGFVLAIALRGRDYDA